MSGPIKDRVLLAALLAVAAACTAEPVPTASLAVDLPERDIPGVPLRAMADPFFRITVEGPGVDPVIVVRGTPGSRVEIEVPAGRDRVVRGELLPEDGALPTHAGEIEPFDLAAGERRSVTLDLLRLPVDEGGFNGWLKVVAGRTQTCGIDVDGGLWCWGLNAGGAAMDADALFSPAPAPFVAPGPFVDVALSDREICAAKQAGGVVCAGVPSDDTSDGSLRQVDGLPGPIIALAAGSPRFCGLTASGQAWCWGAASFWLDEGMPGAPPIAAFAVTGVAGAVQIASAIEPQNCYDEARATFCARTDAGDVACWGDNEASCGYPGMLGAGVTVWYSDEALPVGLPSAAIDIAVGSDFACALLDTHELWCWGDGYDGLTGRGWDIPVTTPVRATDVEAWANVTDSVVISGISASYRKGCIWTSDHRAGCWGVGEQFERYSPGNSSATYQMTPRGLNLSTPDEALSRISAGHLHTCWSYVDGRLECEGDNGFGQLGTAAGASAGEPQRIDGHAWIDVATARFTACGVRADGTAWCWGSNTNGALGQGLGTGSLARSDLPMQVGTAEDWTAIAAGDDAGGENAHFCGIRSGDVWCWGHNSYSQVADEGVHGWNVTAPVLVYSDGLRPALDVFAGPYGSCARVQDVTVTPLLCWGLSDPVVEDNRFGLPEPMGVLLNPEELPFPGNDARSIVILDRSNCILRHDGDLYCMGSEGSGELGNGGGASDSGLVATLVLSGITSVGGNQRSVCAVHEDNTVSCWGENLAGLGVLGLGDDSAWSKVSPETMPFSTNQGFQSIAFGIGDYYSGVLHGCGIATNGSLWCWGADHLDSYDPGWSEYPYASGVLGVGPIDPWQSAPVGPLAGGPWTKLSLGSGYGCAVDANGGLYCWGAAAGRHNIWNTYYRPLGTGPAFRFSPVAVPDPVLP